MMEHRICKTSIIGDVDVDHYSICQLLLPTPIVDDPDHWSTFRDVSLDAEVEAGPSLHG